MNRRPLWHIMPYRDKNQNVNAPWATPLETFSVESTKRCSFACYVFIFLPLKCQLCFHERKCRDTLRHFKGAQLFPKSLVTSCVLISIENRKRERNETSACVGCKCKSGVHSRYYLQIKRECHKMKAKDEKSHGTTQWQHCSLIWNIFGVPWDEPHALFVYK